MTQWHKERKKEFFYRQAKKEKYRARSAYKLIELDKKFHLLKPGVVVVDLGAAPGSWSQVVLEKIKDNGFLLAVDILPIVPLAGKVHFMKADLFKDSIVEEISEVLPSKADLVISDVAPEFSGIKSRDIGLANELSSISFKIAKEALRKGGNFVCKVFPSQDTDELIKDVKGYFEVVKIVKPKASLKGSSEVYIVAKNLF
jgi:23S rRNA (uridine2552-2'-O)-methyltransferase